MFKFKNKSIISNYDQNKYKNYPNLTFGSKKSMEGDMSSLLSVINKENSDIVRLNLFNQLFEEIDPAGYGLSRPTLSLSPAIQQKLTKEGLLSWCFKENNL